ncbi:hypothetical protein [Streptomyces sp. NPDC058812]|uniref:hypothetical protein n=1 Tax=unclassified Streptomyces TaxID=2593676 RepID=UPI0036AA73D6
MALTSSDSELRLEYQTLPRTARARTAAIFLLCPVGVVLACLRKRLVHEQYTGQLADGHAQVPG